MKSKKLVLELSESEYRFILEGLREIRRYTQSVGWPKSQRDLKIRKLLTLESHIEDSWEADQ